MCDLGFVAASIETKSEFAPAYAQALSAALSGPVGITLLRSSSWFVRTLALIAVGRLVLRMDVLRAPSPTNPTHPDAVTLRTLHPTDYRRKLASLAFYELARG